MDIMKPIPRSNAIGWQFINNQCGIRSRTDSLLLKSKPVKRIAQRTRILNKELKKIAKIKSYSQYVRIKTKILREVSEDELVEEPVQNTSVSRIQTSPESISAYWSSDENLSQKFEENTNPGQKTDHKPVHEDTISTEGKNHWKTKKNLSTILKNSDRTNLDKPETVNNINGYIDNNNRSSSSMINESRISVGNVPLGDSGIDDNSQGNSSTSNQDNDDGTELSDGTQAGERYGEHLNNSPNLFTQANNIQIAKVTSEKSFSNENAAGKFLQSDTGNEAIYESSDEEEREKELSQTSIDNDKVEESVLEEETIEKSVLEEETMKESSQIAENDLEIEKSLFKEDTIENASQLNENNDNMGSTLLEEKVANSPQFHDDDVEGPSTEETIEKHSLSDTYGDEIDEPLAEEQIIESLSQSDKNNDESEKILIVNESAQNVSQFHDVNDDQKDDSRTNKDGIETSLYSDTHNDSFKKKTQPTIMCSEIVTSKYTIIRKESEKEIDIGNQSRELEIVENNNELTQFDELSSEAERVSKLKRINLLCSGTESDSSADDDEFKQTPVQPAIKLSSQIISDLSDSENSDSLALHISDSEDEKTLPTTHNDEQKIEPLQSGKLANKSIKDQIKEQAIIDSSPRIEEKTVNNEDTEKVDANDEEKNGSPENHQAEINEKRKDNRLKRKKRRNEAETLYETESLQYVLNNLSRRNFNNEDSVEERLQNTEENLPRPIELHDFVAREELIPSHTSSTITLKDITKIGKERNGDEEIWLMEIPKSIVTDPGLCGQSIVIEKDGIRIGGTNYHATRKHIKAVSCILRKNDSKKTRYKAVNIRPVYSINVRHERTANENILPLKASPLSKSVPFPKNVKSRNPLLVENKTRLSSSENTNSIAGNDKEKRLKVKKRKNSLWNMDNFISKSKRTKVDLLLANGSKNGDFFNE
ncbi:uncharacterized protein PF11_0213-like [Venturia canescens]|uniref:uncharacterized protein PF11_0213-like n=1 Tax=Venturia canescens TaxID=32260 RepID=UPI001C9C8989|nr:uncharacterized protein PF11_0213-like [Venturia canescens]XP_043276047.1 uncharacterized protein PF11_0213-like [Venturia canescens]